MSFPKPPGIKTFLLVVEVMPSKKGLDLPRMLSKLDTLICNYGNATSILYKFKVSGESKVLSVVQTTNIIALERTIAGLWRLGGVQVECVPIISFELFAHNIKVNDHLTKPNSGVLAKEGLYWMEFDIGHSGRSTDELLKIWRNEAEAVLSARYNEGTSMELYKALAERKVHIFINADNPEHIDMLSMSLPMMQENGANVQIKCKALQMLEDYTHRYSSPTELL